MTIGVLVTEHTFWNINVVRITYICMVKLLLKQVITYFIKKRIEALASLGSKHEFQVLYDKCIFSALKGIVRQFWIYNILFVSQLKKHFLRRVHLDKTTLTRIIGKIGCTKSVRPSTVIYIIIYITRTDFAHHFSLLFRVRVVLSRWTFWKNIFFVETPEKIYILEIGEQSL